MSATTPDHLFRFIQINDLHMPGPALEKSGDEARARANRARWLLDAVRNSATGGSTLPAVDLVLGVGDFVQGNDPESLVTELDLFASLTRTLQVPFYPVLGNHDYQEGDADTDLRFLRACGHSALSYSFEHEGITFIMFDNRPLSSPQPEAERTGWLRTTLERHGDMPKIVCCHVPLVPLRDQRSMDEAGVEGCSAETIETLRAVEDHANSVLAVLTGAPAPERFSVYPVDLSHLHRRHSRVSVRFRAVHRLRRPYRGRGATAATRLGIERRHLRVQLRETWHRPRRRRPRHQHRVHDGDL